MTDTAAFIEAARSLVGKPFRHRGRTAHGVDCLGLVLHSASLCGMQWPDRRYDLHPVAEPLREELEDLFGSSLERDQMQPGDLLLIRLPRHAKALHLAIVAEYRHSPGLTMIHAHSGPGVCEHGISPAWLARVEGVYRWQQ